MRRFYEIVVRAVIVAVVITMTGGNVVCAQIPGLPQPDPQPRAITEPPKKAVVSTAGPIKVKESISDRTIQQFLAEVSSQVSRREQGERYRRRRRGELGGTGGR